MDNEKETGPNCATCKYRATIYAPPPSIERMTVCKRFPPVAIIMQGPQGVAVTSAFPAVSPGVWCHEWTPDEAANTILTS